MFFPERDHASSAAEAGMWDGKHFTDYVDTVRSLTRAGRAAEAIELLGHLVEATERDAAIRREGVAPWYYEQLAKLHRKRGDLSAERTVLERFAAQPYGTGAAHARLLRRLAEMDPPSSETNDHQRPSHG
jgi:hypothetical protein